MYIFLQQVFHFGGGVGKTFLCSHSCRRICVGLVRNNVDVKKLKISLHSDKGERIVKQTNFTSILMKNEKNDSVVKSNECTKEFLQRIFKIVEGG